MTLLACPIDVALSYRCVYVDLAYLPHIGTRTHARTHVHRIGGCSLRNAHAYFRTQAYTRLHAQTRTVSRVRAGFNTSACAYYVVQHLRVQRLLFELPLVHTGVQLYGGGVPRRQDDRTQGGRPGPRPFAARGGFVERACKRGHGSCCYFAESTCTDRRASRWGHQPRDLPGFLSLAFSPV